MGFGGASGLELDRLRHGGVNREEREEKSCGPRGEEGIEEVDPRTGYALVSEWHMRISSVSGSSLMDLGGDGLLQLRVGGTLEAAPPHISATIACVGKSTP